MIVITGASRGIGKYLLGHFIGEGRPVIGIAHQTIPDLHQPYYYQLDVRNEEQISQFVKARSNEFNELVLINAAGISYSAFAHKANPDNWRDVIDTNLIGLFNLTKQLLPFMRGEQYGRVINFSSVVAQQGVAGTSAYAASKSALWGLAKTLSAENAARNVTVNNINLGYFNIGMIEQVPPDLLGQIIKQIPTGRLGEPAEILSTVKYIIDNAYLNGASIDLNGGLY